MRLAYRAPKPSRPSEQRPHGPDTLRDLNPAANSPMAGRVLRQHQERKQPVTTNRTGVGFVFGQSELARSQHGERARRRADGHRPTGCSGVRTSCLTTDSTSSPYFVGMASARFEYARRSISGQPAREWAGGTRPDQQSFGNNCNGGNSQLTRQNGWWESPWITFRPDQGRNAFYLCWKAGAKDGNFGQRVIQMAFACEHRREPQWDCVLRPDDLCDDRTVPSRPRRQPARSK